MATPAEIRVSVNGVDNTAGAFSKARAACRDFAADIRRTVSGAGGGDLFANSIGNLSRQVQGLLAGSGSIASLGNALASCGATGAAALGPVGIALGAIGAGVASAARNCAKFAKEMSAVTDAAQRARTTSSALQKLSQAMSVVGIRGGDMENLATAMAHMQKTVGVQGTEAFLGVLHAVSEVEDAQERAARMTEYFGRTGENLLSLVDAHGELLDQLVEIANGYETASERAMDAGDRMADAMSDSAFRGKQVWYSFWGEFLNVLQTTSVETRSYWDEFLEGARRCLEVVGGILGGILKAIKLTFDTFLWMLDNIYRLFDGIVGLVAELFGEGELGDRFAANADAAMEAYDRIAAESGEMLHDIASIGSAQVRVEADRAAAIAALREKAAEDEAAKEAEIREKGFSDELRRQERLHADTMAFARRYAKAKRDALALRRELDNSPRESKGAEYGSYEAARIASFARAQSQGGGVAEFARYFGSHGADETRADAFYRTRVVDLLGSLSGEVRSMVADIARADGRLASLMAL